MIFFQVCVVCANFTEAIQAIFRIYCDLAGITFLFSFIFRIDVQDEVIIRVLKGLVDQVMVSREHFSKGFGVQGVVDCRVIDMRRQL